MTDLALWDDIWEERVFSIVIPFSRWVCPQPVQSAWVFLRKPAALTACWSRTETRTLVTRASLGEATLGHRLVSYGGGITGSTFAVGTLEQ